MATQDLSLAQARLRESKLTLVIAKSGRIIFETDRHGISGFLAAVDDLCKQLQGVSIADKVVGRAVALLCVHYRVKAVYASVLSRAARAVFAQHGFYCEWKAIVKAILCSDKKNLCPFEELAAGIRDPSEAYLRLKVLQSSMAKHKHGSW